MSRIFNIASLLSETARKWPDRPAVISPHRPDALGRGVVSFKELDESSDRLAAHLADKGLPAGDRLVVLARPGIDFTTIIFGLFKAGLVPILVDPGLGPARLLRCLAESRPSGLVGIPLAHLVSFTSWGFLSKIKLRVTVGRRWGWGGATLAEILKSPAPELPAPESPAPEPSAPEQPRELPAPTGADDLAAVLFTSGSTGPAKGVIYTHAMFAAQVEAIREGLDIRPGGRDLATFPLFGLFAPALGLTSVIPDLNPARPAQADPQAVLYPIFQHRITSLFASPSLLTRVASYAHERGLALPSLERVITAGAPVAPRAAASFFSLMNAGAVLQTPYGATEGVPLSRIDAEEILSRTRAMTERGLGMCVGRPLPGVRLAVIKITDEVISEFHEHLLLPVGEIGEIIAQGPMVSRGYFDRPAETAASIIPEGPPAEAGKDGAEGAGKFWRRMGDVGWLDVEGRLWFCGRKAHRVITEQGTLFSIPCEAVFNNHPLVRRSALVGYGPPGRQRPVIIIEPNSRLKRPEWLTLAEELAALAKANPRNLNIGTFLRHKAFPVDARHNAKINREALAVWAKQELEKASRKD